MKYKTLIPLLISFDDTATAEILVEFEFERTSFSGDIAPPPANPIASSDSQFTVVNSAVTFQDPINTLHLIGGNSLTSAWQYIGNAGTADGDLTSAYATDLHSASTFGAPTRFDLDLGTAAAGQSYTITSVEIDVTAASADTYHWDFMYKDLSGKNQIISGGNIAIQTAAGGTRTYKITGLNLTATDSTTDWNTIHELRFAFWDSAGSEDKDNLRIHAIRVIGNTF